MRDPSTSSSMDSDYKLRQELDRLAVDLNNLQAVMNNRIGRIRRRMEKIKELEKERERAGRQTQMMLKNDNS